MQQLKYVSLKKEVGNLYYIFEKIIKERGISLYRVSKDTGIPYSTLNDWKNGKSKPKVDKLIKIATYLGVSLDELLNVNNKTVCQQNEWNYNKGGQLGDDATKN